MLSVVIRDRKHKRRVEKNFFTELGPISITAARCVAWRCESSDIVTTATKRFEAVHCCLSLATQRNAQP